MGCAYSKTEEKTDEGRMLAFLFRRRNKVVPMKVPEQDGSSVNDDSPVTDTASKTEQTVLPQLTEDGLVSKQVSGGVAFVIEMKGDMADTEECRTLVHGPPRRLPPLHLSKSKASIDNKLEKAKRNRDRRLQERRARWARRYARIQASVENSDVEKC